MKKTLVMIALLAFAATAIPAQNTVPPANGQGQRQGQMKQKKQGKKSGPQDGSSPLHTPGTGGGTGKGQRGPRR